MTALTAHSFAIKKGAKMSVFLCENRKNLLVGGGFTSRLPVVAPHFAKSWVPTEQKEWSKPIIGKANE